MASAHVYQVVRQAAPNGALISKFIDAAKKLESDGAVDIIAANKKALSAQALYTAGITSQQIKIIGMDSSTEFKNLIHSHDSASFNQKLLTDDVVFVARDLFLHPRVKPALVLECTNLQAYAPRLTREFNCIVFSQS